VHQDPVGALLERRIAQHFQDPRLVPSFSAASIRRFPLEKIRCIKWYCLIGSASAIVFAYPGRTHKESVVNRLGCDSGQKLLEDVLLSEDVIGRDDAGCLRV
jgi:hypothetical protein